MKLEYDNNNDDQENIIDLIEWEHRSDDDSDDQENIKEENNGKSKSNNRKTNTKSKNKYIGLVEREAVVDKGKWISKTIYLLIRVT